MIESEFLLSLNNKKLGRSDCKLESKFLYLTHNDKTEIHHLSKLVSLNLKEKALVLVLQQDNINTLSVKFQSKDRSLLLEWNNLMINLKDQLSLEKKKREDTRVKVVSELEHFISKKTFKTKSSSTVMSHLLPLNVRNYKDNIKTKEEVEEEKSDNLLYHSLQKNLIDLKKNSDLTYLETFKDIEKRKTPVLEISTVRLFKSDPSNQKANNNDTLNSKNKNPDQLKQLRESEKELLVHSLTNDHLILNKRIPLQTNTTKNPTLNENQTTDKSYQFYSQELSIKNFNSSSPAKIIHDPPSTERRESVPSMTNYSESLIENQVVSNIIEKRKNSLKSLGNSSLFNNNNSPKRKFSIDKGFYQAEISGLEIGDYRDDIFLEKPLQDREDYKKMSQNIVFESVEGKLFNSNDLFFDSNEAFGFKENESDAKTKKKESPKKKKELQPIREEQGIMGEGDGELMMPYSEKLYSNTILNINPFPVSTPVNEFNGVIPLSDFNNSTSNLAIFNNMDQKKIESKFVWNQTFQTAIESIHKAGTFASDEILKFQEVMSSVETEFINYSKGIGEIIINELYVPLEKKTIKPSKVGGIIGNPFIFYFLFYFLLFFIFIYYFLFYLLFIIIYYFLFYLMFISFFVFYFLFFVFPTLFEKVEKNLLCRMYYSNLPLIKQEFWMIMFLPR